MVPADSPRQDRRRGAFRLAGAGMSRCGDLYENRVTGERAVVLRGSEDRGDGPGLAHLTVRPGGAVVGEHVHPFIVETFTVLAGRLDARIGGVTSALGPGQSATAEAGVPHDWWNAGAEPAEVLVAVAPAAGVSARPERFEELIGMLFGLANAGRTDRKGRPWPLQAAVIAQEFADVIRFTHPPAWVQRPLIAALAPLGRALGYRAFDPDLARPAGRATPADHALAAAGLSPAASA